MKYFIISPDHDEVQEFDDTTEGEKDALEMVASLSREGWGADEIIVIRGERFKFVPPSDNGQLVRVSP